MADAILVLNAGSSSLKFSVFRSGGGELELSLRGQAEGLTTKPRFTAQDASGKSLSERTWKAQIERTGASPVPTVFESPYGV